MMIYHNIIHSNENRIIKKVIDEQMRMDREGTWLNGLQKMMEMYGIVDVVSKITKSKWKSILKEKM